MKDIIIEIKEGIMKCRESGMKPKYIYINEKEKTKLGLSNVNIISGVEIVVDVRLEDGKIYFSECEIDNLNNNKEGGNNMKDVIIVNRDFSVLEGLESVNKWGMKTKIVDVKKCFVKVTEWFDSDYPSLDIGCIQKNDVTDGYIIERLGIYGFNITFQDIDVINTIKQLWLFMATNHLQLSTSAEGGKFCFCRYSAKKANEYVGSLIEIEKEYNVKLEVLR